MVVNDIDIEVIRSRRRTVSLAVKGCERIVVRAPLRLSQAKIEEFIEQHRAWIEKRLAENAERAARVAQLEPIGDEETRALAKAARADLPERVRRLAPQVGVSYGRVSIRMQKTRWGSCSSKGNLNFNCLLMLAPERVRDYVVVHELCHRKEMNHSPRFWAEVERVLPDYREQLAWLKENGSLLMARAGL